MAENAPAEVSTKCSGCGKTMRKITRYYRNGKYYCNKKCWLNTVKPAAQEQEAKE